MLRMFKPQMLDILEMAANLRDIDRLEAEASSGMDAVRALTVGVEASVFCCGFADDDDNIVCIGGVVDNGNRLGTPWMLGTNSVSRYRKEAVRYGLGAVGMLKSIFDRLENVVHVDNEASIRWLGVLGFEVDVNVSFDLNGELFYEFHWSRRGM